jgi:hypothetical protein
VSYFAKLDEAPGAGGGLIDRARRDTILTHPTMAKGLASLFRHHPGRPSGFDVRRILGKGDLWITEYIITYQGRPTFTVSVMEFRDRKVIHETQYFADPFDAPDWRSQWVQRIS